MQMASSMGSQLELLGLEKASPAASLPVVYYTSFLVSLSLSA